MPSGTSWIDAWTISKPRARPAFLGRMFSARFANALGEARCRCHPEAYPVLHRNTRRAPIPQRFPYALTPLSEDEWKAREGNLPAGASGSSASAVLAAE